MFEERALVVERPDVVREVVLFDPAGADLAAEDHLPKARALFFEERDDPQREVQVMLGCEPTHLQRDDDAKGAVPLAAVAVRIAVGPQAEHPGPARAVLGNEVADRVVVDGEAEGPECLLEVHERATVLRGEGVPTDGVLGARVLRPGQGLDVPDDPVAGALALLISGGGRG